LTSGTSSVIGVCRIAARNEEGTDPNLEINERSFSPRVEPITKEIIWPHSKILVAGSFRFADGSKFARRNFVRLIKRKPAEAWNDAAKYAKR